MENNNFSEFNDNNFLVDDKIVDKLKNIQVKNMQIRPDWYTNLGQFYKDYIQPNLFAIIALILLSIFLIIRYFVFKDKKKKKLKKSLKIAMEIQNNTNSNEQKHTIDDNDEYLDKYIDDIMENEELTFDDDNDDNNKKNDLSGVDKIIKYYDDMEKSGMTSSQYIERERENEIKKLNFNQLAKLVTGGSD